MTNLGLSASKFTEQGELQKISAMFTAQSVQLSQSKDGQSVANFTSSKSSALDDEAYEDMSEPVSVGAPKALETQTKIQPLNTSCHSAGKPSKQKQSEKDSFVSIKSFFSQAEPCEEKLKNSVPKDSVLPEMNAPSKTRKSIAGFFALKMKSTATASSDFCSSANEPKFERGSCTDGSSEDLKDTAGCVESLTSTHPETFFSNEEEGVHNSGYSVHLTTSNKLSEVESKALDTYSSVTKSVHLTVPANPALCDAQPSGSAKGSASFEDFMECDSCGEMVSVWEMPEHSDYHFAIELQKEVNKTLAQTSNLSSSSGNFHGKRKMLTGSGKGGRGGKKSKGVTRDKSIQPLTAFFSKS